MRTSLALFVTAADVCTCIEMNVNICMNPKKMFLCIRCAPGMAAGSWADAQGHVAIVEEISAETPVDSGAETDTQ